VAHKGNPARRRLRKHPRKTGPISSGSGADDHGREEADTGRAHRPTEG
jgi:hypothetical protein